MKFSNMTDEDLCKAMEEIAQTCRAEADFIDQMRKGTNKLPRDSTARKEVIKSHQRLVAKIQQQGDEMYAELMRRWEKFTTPA